MSMYRGQQRPPLPMKYRRRRTYALLLLILLIWGIWSGIGTMFNGGGAQQAKAGEACAAGAVQIVPHIGDGSTDATQFFQGETIQMWYELTNIGNVPCKFNVGSKVTFFKITSGPETIWDSHQCDRGSDSDLEITLEPNKSEKSTPSTWDQVRSSDSGCNASSGQTPVDAGGASYHLAVTVNNVLSANDIQFTLN
ncbi:MAG: hypothetical protein ACKOWE_03115 [Micrococcales bacterium]